MRGESIIQPGMTYRAGGRVVVGIDPACLVTGDTARLDVHHVFHGPFRSKSDELGCWCYLRHEVHMALHAHQAPWGDLDRALKERCQRTLEGLGWERERFIREFGRSYL